MVFGEIIDDMADRILMYINLVLVVSGARDKVSIWEAITPRLPSMKEYVIESRFVLSTLVLPIIHAHYCFFLLKILLLLIQ